MMNALSTLPNFDSTRYGNFVGISVAKSEQETEQQAQAVSKTNERINGDVAGSSDSVTISEQGRTRSEQASSVSSSDNDSKQKQDPNTLSEEEQQQVKELKQRDAEVRAHEQAHAAVGGQYAGAPSYDYQRGPDGNRYAVGGEVQIDVGEEEDPEATIQKMQVVRRAALAPAEPSSQDYKVAAEASQKEIAARAELGKEQTAERNGDTEPSDLKDTVSDQNVSESRLQQTLQIKQYLSVQKYE
ncbi:putative metalloprotease CJM1_0395 family protein [Agaribacter flavus]|uniref:Metalloprotease CJM1_0395 family protein n=1 Tax=Agaribacter flavus TaxID=1902781 RepID=A0ABV7FQI3_9ALTE